MKKNFNSSAFAEKLVKVLDSFFELLPDFMEEQFSDLDDLDKEAIMNFLYTAKYEEILFMLNNPRNYFDLYFISDKDNVEDDWEYDESQDEVIDEEDRDDDVFNEEN